MQSSHLQILPNMLLVSLDLSNSSLATLPRHFFVSDQFAFHIYIATLPRHPWNVSASQIFQVLPLSSTNPSKTKTKTLKLHYQYMLMAQDIGGNMLQNFSSTVCRSPSATRSPTIWPKTTTATSLRLTWIVFFAIYLILRFWLLKLPTQYLMVACCYLLVGAWR